MKTNLPKRVSDLDVPPSDIAILLEAKRLYDLGLAVHWTRAGSKAPVKTGWSSSKRDDWGTLLDEHQFGYGLGIRLGAASKLANGYLAVVDLDVRSPDKRFYSEAIAVIDRVFPGLLGTTPTVLTGRGFGSRHLYIGTSSPLPSKKLEVSPEQVKVYSPTSEISGPQIRAMKERKISAAELQKGYRIKSAWEVEFMSIGKQVVAPPSQHVDTGALYRWERDLR